MTKQETAEQIARGILHQLHKHGFAPPAEKIVDQMEIYAQLGEEIESIAAESIAEFMGYVAKGTQRNG